MNTKSRKIVYFGNKISGYRKAKSVMETLIPLFEQQYIINSYSSYQNKVLKMLDMIVNFFLKGLRAHVIIIDVYSTANFYFAVILSFLSHLFKVPYILFLHGGNLPNRYTRSEKLVDYIFKNSKSIVAPSNYLKSFFEDKGYQITYIPNIINLELYQFKERKQISPKLLYIRGFGKIYNPLMAVKAIGILKEKFPSIELVMLGSDIDGTLEETNALIKELNLSQHIKILGKMSQENWIKLSYGYDIMVSTPTIDNTPVSVIEGMALGLIIVSTDVGGIAHLLKNMEDSILVASDAHEELASKIEFSLMNPEFSYSLQLNARKKIEEFTWEKTKDKWFQLLNE
ncbi:MAG: glycosyltransferase family 4 protein [Bacteroidota bacterium]